MAVEIIAGLLIVAASVLLSKGLANNIQKKRKLYSEFCEFINFAQGEISFYNKTFEEIIKKYIDENPKSELSEILKDNKKISEQSKFIKEYIEEVKKLDKSAQKTYSENVSEKIKAKLKNTEAEDKKKAELYKKIIPLFGIAAFILLL